MTTSEGAAPGDVDAIAAALRSLVPASLSLRTGARALTDDDVAALHGIEHAAMANAIARRRREFASGRALLRELLESDARIGVLPSRAPAWPENVVGSLAHDDAVAVAVVFVARRAGFELSAPETSARPASVDAQRAQFEAGTPRAPGIEGTRVEGARVEGARVEGAGVEGVREGHAQFEAGTPPRALGIDIEPEGSADDVAAAILRPEERGLDATLALCAKEAVYKAWSALGGPILEHHDVALTVDSAGSFVAVVHGVTTFRGSFARVRGRVVVLVIA